MKKRECSLVGAGIYIPGFINLLCIKENLMRVTLTAGALFRHIINMHFKKESYYDGRKCD